MVVPTLLDCLEGGALAPPSGGGGSRREYATGRAQRCRRGGMDLRGEAAEEEDSPSREATARAQRSPLRAIFIDAIRCHGAHAQQPAGRSTPSQAQLGPPEPRWPANFVAKVGASWSADHADWRKRAPRAEEPAALVPTEQP